MLALVLVIGVHPISAGLRRRGWPPWAAPTVMILTSIAMVLGMEVAPALSIAELASVLSTYQSKIAALEAQLAEVLARLGIGRQQGWAALSGRDFGAIAGVIAGLLAGLAVVLSNLFFLLILLLFMGLDAAGFGDRASPSVPVGRTSSPRSPGSQEAAAATRSRTTRRPLSGPVAVTVLRDATRVRYFADLEARCGARGS